MKVTNEPPTGMHANLHAALDNFDQVSACHALVHNLKNNQTAFFFFVPQYCNLDLISDFFKDLFFIHCYYFYSALCCESDLEFGQIS